MNQDSRQNISVLIPCRNEENYIEKAVCSILDQDYPKGEIEVIVIDGMSDDGTLGILKKLAEKDARVKLVNNEARTTPQAMNLGLAAAQYDLILRIDAHAIALPNFLTLNVDALQEDEAVMCAGGRIINIYENKVSELIGYAMSSPFGVGNATFRIGGEKKYVDTLAFGIYRKKVFELIGNFNEELVRNQDDELNYRLTKNGFKILYDPAIQSQYFVRGSISKLYKQYFQYGYWKVYVNKLHKAVTSIRQLVPLIFVLGIIFGGAITAILPFFAFLYFPGIALYLMASVYFGIKSAKSVATGLRVALVFPVLHWSYGIGYLKGIIMFLLFNKKPSNKSKSLSRK